MFFCPFYPTLVTQAAGNDFPVAAALTTIVTNNSAHGHVYDD